MKKILRYMQDQALQYSDSRFSGSAYLTAPGKEPQQRSSKHYKQQHIVHAQNRSSHPSAHAHTLTYYNSGAGGSSSTPARIQHLKYADDNVLQSVQVYIPDPPTPDISSLSLNNNMNSERQTDYQPPIPRQSVSGASTPTLVGNDSNVDTDIPKYWIVYIHGGYFRDPETTATSFNTALSALFATESSSAVDSIYKDIQPHIAGCASIDYRLAAHSEHPQDPAKTPNNELRNAKWPEPLHDVLHAISFLQIRYGFQDNYILAGHSVGATLAMLAVLHDMSNLGVKIMKPQAVLGLCGIYDFHQLHSVFPAYESMTSNTIPDPQKWKEISPAAYDLKHYKNAWSEHDRDASRNTKWVFLAHSRGDELVDWTQVEAMSDTLTQTPDAKPEERNPDQDTQEKDIEIRVKVIEVKGGHNDVWAGARNSSSAAIDGSQNGGVSDVRTGNELARAIAESLRELLQHSVSSR